MSTTRTIITLSEEEKIWLDRYSKTIGISMAEAIRRGIRGLIDRERSATYKASLDATKGVWEGEDGLQYQQRLREEWH